MRLGQRRMQALIVYITPGFENIDAAAPLKGLLAEIAEAGGTKAHVILSGEAIDLLADSAPELLRQYVLLLSSGKIPSAATFSYDPIPAELGIARLVRSAELRLTWFEKLGLPRPTVFFSPAALDKSVISGLIGLGIKTIVIRDPKNRSVTPLLAAPDSTLSVLEDGLEPPVRVSIIDRPYLRTLTFPTLKELVYGLTNLTPLPDALNAAARLPLNADEIESRLVAEKAEAQMNSPIVRRFQARRALVEREFEPVPERVKNSAHFTANTEHQRLAELYLLRLHTPETVDQKLFGDPIFRHYLYRSILHAQVEIDAVSRPDIDPTAGWVDLVVEDFDHDGSLEIQVDSQLQRLFFRGTRLIEWDYKPRKADFLNLLLPHPREAFSGPAESAALTVCRMAAPGQIEPVKELEQAVEKPKLIRQSPDLITFRVRRRVKLELPDGAVFSAAIIKDLSVHAGIGAHLNNATTGFSIEYWLETNDKIDDSLILCDEWNIALPSADAAGWSGRLLHGGGGTSEHPFELADVKAADGYNTPGGLHGIRLIDGLGPLVIDLRSAKPLSAAEVVPIATEENFEPAGFRQIIQGVKVKMSIAAKRVGDEFHTNTLFVSIL